MKNTLVSKIQSAIASIKRNLTEGGKMSGHWELTTRNTVTGVVNVTDKFNLIVDDGFDMILDALATSGVRPDVLSHVAVGSGVTAPNAVDSTLEAQIIRGPGTYVHAAGTKSLSFTATFLAGVGTGAITEAAMFNASSGGKMLNRVTFGVINKGADDELTVKFTLTLS